MQTGRSQNWVLMFVFGREEEWSTNTVCGIGVQTVYMLCCLFWCLSDRIGTASGAMFLFDIAY